MLRVTRKRKAKVRLDAHIASLVNAIKPSVDKVANMEGDKLDNAVRANVERVVAQVHDDLKERAQVVGMVYDLDTGRAQ